MSARQWQPGDVGVGTVDGKLRRLVADLSRWEPKLRFYVVGLDNAADDSDGWRFGWQIPDARPFVTIDPEQTDLYLQSDGRDMTLWADEDPPRALLTEHAADDLLWAHLKATLPTREEPQDEPTDPGVRVVDIVQGEWGRVGEKWVSASGGILQWEALCEVYGPLEVIQPDAPSADERPFKRGDRVRVADDARTDDDGTGIMSLAAGKVGVYDKPSQWGGAAVITVDGMPGQRVGHSYLTHAVADAPC